jgi:FkbM family methyltransferase
MNSVEASLADRDRSRWKSPGKEFSRQVKYLIGQDAFRRNPASVLGRLLVWRAISAVSHKKVVIKLPGYGVSIAIPSEWSGIAKLIFAYRELYDRELVWLSRNVRLGFFVADIGASFGIYTLVAARAAGPSGQIFSFEPAASTFDILKTNVELNCLTNVHTFRYAIGEEDGEVELYHHRDSSRNSLGRTTAMTGTSESVHKRTLSNVLAKAGIAKIDLIKMDVEGMEEMALRGCSSIVERARPKIIIELNPGRASAIGLHADGAWELLRSLRYKMYEIGRAGELLKVDRPPQHLVNVVAFPHE